MSSHLDALGHVLQAAVEAGSVPGVVAAVTSAEETLWSGAFGVRSLTTGEPMLTDTVGAIMSMTKPITGAAAIQCVERGLLDLDAPAGDLIPFLGEVQVLDGFDDEGQPQLRPPSSKVTLRNLLTHTAGFAYDIWNTDLKQYVDQVGETSASFTHQHIKRPLMFDPGERWEYSVAIDWVGLMVEAATSKTLGRYLSEEFFGPLAMNSTSFELSDTELAQAASLHVRDGKSGYHVSPPKQRDTDFDSGGGGLYSNMDDYVRFMRMILNGGELDGARVLSQESVDLMATNSMGDLRVVQLPSTNLTISNHAELMPGIPKSWGLTFQINEEPVSGGRSAGSLSWAGMYNSYFWIDRTNNIAGTYMTQMLPFADVESVGLFETFEQATYSALRG
jgi:methyl acetate hydrolase